MNKNKNNNNSNLICGGCSCESVSYEIHVKGGEKIRLDSRVKEGRSDRKLICH